VPCRRVNNYILDAYEWLNGSLVKWLNWVNCPAPISREQSSIGAGSSLRYEILDVRFDLACWPCHAVAYRYEIYRLLAVCISLLANMVGIIP